MQIIFEQIYLIQNEIQTGTTIPDKSEPGTNNNEKKLHPPLGFRCNLVSDKPSF